MSLELPNYTLIIQFLLFIGVVFVLNLWVFNPVLQVIHERRKKTTETAKNTEKILKATEGVVQKYEAELSEYRNALYQKKEAVRQKFLKEQAEQLQETRHILSTHFKQQREMFKKKTDEAQKELERETQDIALQVVKKIMEK